MVVFALFSASPVFAVADDDNSAAMDWFSEVSKKAMELDQSGSGSVLEEIDSGDSGELPFEDYNSPPGSTPATTGEFDRQGCEKEKDSLAVIYGGEWACLKNAKTYSTVTSVDEGAVFVRRLVDREHQIPLRKGDRLMDGDEIVMTKISEMDHTRLQISWDDGKEGLVWFNRYSGDSRGTFYVGKRRNESNRISIMENPDGSVEVMDREVFPTENPELIELYGKDAFDIGMQIITSMPKVPLPISVGANILLSPTQLGPSPMTFINIKSDIMLEPRGGGEWTLYTFEGAPEVIRLDDEGNVIDNTIVTAGHKVVVSSSAGAEVVEDFDPSAVERFIYPSQGVGEEGQGLEVVADGALPGSHGSIFQRIIAFIKNLLRMITG